MKRELQEQTLKGKACRWRIWRGAGSGIGSGADWRAVVPIWLPYCSKHSKQAKSIPLSTWFFAFALLNHNYTTLFFRIVVI